mgnify:CR=1 FL=1
MKLGVFTCLLNHLSLEEALQYFSSLGIQMIELGCGGTPGNAHCNPEHDQEIQYGDQRIKLSRQSRTSAAGSCRHV